MFRRKPNAKGQVDKMKRKISLYLAICSLFAFVLWTFLVRFINVQAIGPQGSKVGFASVNGFFYALIGVNMRLYVITDWLGLVPVFIAFGFAIFGLIQWIKRKNILKVDYSILALGVFYIVVFSAYILFEYVVINYRPVLINGYLETSYPSSTTLLVTCVMPTEIIELRRRIKNNALKQGVTFTMIAFILFMVVGRFISGVHWFSDIVGGLLLSAGLVLGYDYATSLHGAK